MEATCKHVSGAELPPPANGAAYTPTSDLHLTRGKRYEIGGIGVFEGVSLVLVRDDTGRPNWRPLAAFQVAAQPIPAHWEFVADDGDGFVDGWTALMGYRELVHEPDHLPGLIERDPKALATYDSQVDRRGP